MLVDVHILFLLSHLQLSPVPEQSITNVNATAAVAADGNNYKQLFKSQSQQQRGSHTPAKLSVLLLPGITCEGGQPCGGGAGTAGLETRSAPASPIHGNMTFLSRSLSLIRAREQQATPPKQQVGQLCSVQRRQVVPGCVLVRKLPLQLVRHSIKCSTALGS